MLSLGIPLAVLSACTTGDLGHNGQSDALGAEVVLPPLPCGVTAGHMAGINGRPQLQDDLVPPCEPINADQIEYACSVKDSWVTYNPNLPNDPEPVDWNYPEYDVHHAQCRNQNEDGSILSCDFDLVHEDGQIRVTNQEFRYQYWEEHGPTSHWYNSSWFAGDSCLAPPSE